MKQRYDIQSVPSLSEFDDHYLHPPPRAEVHHGEPDRENMVGGVEIAAYFFVSLLIIFGMWYSVDSVGWGMFYAVLFFGFATTFRTLAKTGTLKAWLQDILHHRGDMRRVAVWEELAHRRMDMMEEIERSKLPPPPVHTLSAPAADNFVPAYTPTDIAEAIAYAESLYGSDGYLSRQKVHANGKIRGGVIGSQSRRGNQNARQYLIDRRFLIYREGGYWVAKSRYPSTVELSRLHVG